LSGFVRDQNGDLERRAGRLVTGAISRGLAVNQVVSEVGSGMDGRRRKLAKVLSDPAVTVVVVEHVVLGDGEISDDLVGDVTGVLTSLGACRYGRCSALRRAAEAGAVATGGGLG
jgi:putative resolvase